MDSKTTDSIKACLNELRAKALKAFKMQVMKIYSSAEHPVFIPEITVRNAVKAAEDNTRQLLEDTMKQVSAVSAAPEAFTLIDRAIAAHLSDLESVVVQGRGVPLLPTMLKVADEKLAMVRQELFRNLETYRSSFSGSKNKGGAPLTWNWEEAEAYVRGKFPDGIPTKHGMQSKIAKMMAEWFSETYDKEPGKTELNRHAADLVNNRR
ncbi:hypothetical protein [Shinella sp.]|uniref:hypothetical protein n=1 Tax=Shinella sp. TaxID=1870904 RepID=UPI0028B0D460|nr:hypothetical protein [Shinella sp.]